MSEQLVQHFSPDQVKAFFADSYWIDRFVLRPLSHIASNWDASWDGAALCYSVEPDSFAGDLNVVIEQIAQTPPPASYHDYEDTLAEEVLHKLKWPIQKKGRLWVGADYQSILEQGSFGALQINLIISASGRVHAAMHRGQMHFDDMEERHLNMLAGLMAIAIFQRDCSGEALLYEESEEE